MAKETLRQLVGRLTEELTAARREVEKANCLNAQLRSDKSRLTADLDAALSKVGRLEEENRGLLERLVGVEETRELEQHKNEGFKEGVTFVLRLVPPTVRG